MLNYQKILLAFTEWLNAQTALSKMTTTTYLRWIGYFLNYLRAFDVQRLNDIDNTLVHQFVYFHKDQATGEIVPYATTYAKSRLAALGLFFSWSYQAGYCRENPLLRYKKATLQGRALAKTKRPSTPNRVFLTEKEIQRLVQLETGHDTQLVRNKAIVLLILASALYAQDLMQLTLPQLKLKAGYLTRYDTKTDTRYKILLNLNLCQAACQAWLAVRKETLTQPQAIVFFNIQQQPLSKRLLYKVVSETLAAAQIKKPHQGPELLRQTAMHLMSKQWTREEVQAMTGIKNVEPYLAK